MALPNKSNVLDLDYQARVTDGLGNGKLIVDAGVYEYSAAPGD
ncbi:MAG: hypothetical protein R3E08_07705 [Thiotrichaceae bacterium]